MIEKIKRLTNETTGNSRRINREIRGNCSLSFSIKNVFEITIRCDLVISKRTRWQS